MKPELPNLRREIGEGMRYVFRHPLLRPSTGIGVAFTVQALTAPGWMVSWFVIGTLLAGFCIIVSYILQVSTQQRLCPPDLQGRMSATMSFVSWGAAPVGSLLGGALGTAFGLHTTLWIAGLGTLAGNAFLYLSPIRRLRTIPAEEVSPT
ncbi:MFS transporter [Kribbella sp. C-35]|uniref:MFS transporter n=1 Tax=Kribbella sp. C-35 TaxID=2789276 RepID=UPI00397D4D43